MRDRKLTKVPQDQSPESDEKQRDEAESRAVGQVLAGEEV